jgi:hypothetical protein
MGPEIHHQTTCLSTTFSAINATCTGLGSYPDFHGDRLVTKHFSHGTTYNMKHCEGARHSVTHTAESRRREPYVLPLDFS